MSSVFSFHSQLVSVMDALSKAAVLEIGKLVEIESKMLRIEIGRGRKEVASLTEKVQLMENLLWIARAPGHGREAQRRTPAGKGSRGGGPEPGRTGPAIKSERPAESRCPSVETSAVHQDEQLKPATEHPELLVIKVEPSELDDWESRPQQGSEKKAAIITTGNEDVQPDPQKTKKSFGAETYPKAAPDRQRCSGSFMRMCAPSSTSGPRLQEAQRFGPTRADFQNSQLTPAQTNLEPPGRNVAGTTQSLSLAKNMKIHSLRNSSAKRFGCIQCGKSFRCFSQLEIHQRSHTGEKPFRCTLCGKRYAQKGHLYTHQRTHTGEKPYRCPICGKGFIQKCTLDMHQRTHTGEKPFVCVQCGKGFTKNCNLKKHIAAHTDSNMHMLGTELRVPGLHATTSHNAVSQL